MPKEFAYTLDAIVPDSMMVEDLEEAIVHLETLRDLCKAQFRAMRLRADGNITFAQLFEAEVDTLYKCLPSNWQW